MSIGAILLVVALLLLPGTLFQIAASAVFSVFAAALVFRAAIYIWGAHVVEGRPVSASVVNDEESVSWPVYTLLIALKDEAQTAAQLARAICRLDYPRDRLDVKLLIETGDEATREALRMQDWPRGTELLVVPPGMPRTKPRALNYGLLAAKGEFVVVYDAEDKPSPDQLKAAVRAFRSGGPSLACVQAPLVGAGDRGWIAGQWALEYAVQFGRLLPGLAALGMPILLGGTSNHFRRSRLEAAGGWDAWNVTEDADLGLRLARRGNSVGVIAPPTFEAPPEQPMIWLSQRSRWLKGFLQTWLVAMRQPIRAVREMGAINFLALQLTLGASILSALVHGPWAIWLLLAFVLPGVAVAPFYLAFAGIAYLSGLLMALLAPGRKDLRRLLLVLTLPAYWPLQSIAMIRAIYGLIRRPHYWAKTPHPGDLAPVCPGGSARDTRFSSPAC
nr:glycosyltransferase family 2 protein [Hyphomonas sediminis]